ncbi:hypothetical protein ACQFN5_00215 (plasmid) [Klebsiella sp. WOUb02]|uniref:hypothetical protein n=1 Tax=Klebsiella sp. WOUb02 TaxID=3161071 RepID=UPI003CED7ABD
MNAWLVTFQAERHGVEYEHHLLLQGADLPLAEAACGLMADTWWQGERPVCAEGVYRTYVHGSVWLSAIILLSDAELETLTGLKFLDRWFVTGSPDAPVVQDEQDNRWQDFRD